MRESEQIVSLILFNLFFLLFIVAIISFIRQYRLKKKEHAALLHQKNIDHQKELLATQVEIQIQTMKHIGREIHDNIGQQLTLASIYTHQLEFENKSPNCAESITNIGQIINNSLSELRLLSKSLTDNAIEKQSISKLIEAESKKIANLKICNVSFLSTAKKTEIPYQSKSVLLRITQEFLQNSIKHSECKNIEIKLDHTPEKLILTIQDDGIGFDINRINSSGIGLSNMKNRTEIIGGTYFFDSQINKGTKIRIEIFL